ncbi:MAG: type I-F CRISPR-associated protein Csy3 [Pyramidobacter sp.]|jgi:CRISPR-associated protein Csy3
MAKKNNGFASVLAFEKKLVLSDGYMYSTNWDQRHGVARPIQVVEKTVRGTISNRLKPAVKNDPAKLNAEVEKANLQTVDAAALPLNDDTLKLSFTLKVLPGAFVPSACNDADHQRKIEEAGKLFSEEYGFKELAKRYALNIANGRFLWRNRVGAERVEVRVRVMSEEPAKEWTFNGYDYSLKNFDRTDEKTEELSALIADALTGRRGFLMLAVEAFVLVGKGQEIYPSEEMIMDKGKGNKSKVLYSVEGMAAMHSQKLGNAIRTIDTWYPDYESLGIGPIAVDPYGAVTSRGKAYRVPTDKKDFYALFDRWSIGEKLEDENDLNYVMAVLIRGGVFGQSEKE